MRKFLISLVCLALFVGLGSNAFAGRYDREDANDVGYANAASTSVDAALVAVPCYVYGATVLATSANSYALLYDNASAATGTVKIEIGEASQYDTQHITFDPPIRFENGVYADVTSGPVVIEYR